MTKSLNKCLLLSIPFIFYAANIITGDENEDTPTSSTTTTVTATTTATTTLTPTTTTASTQTTSIITTPVTTGATKLTPAETSRFAGLGDMMVIKGAEGIAAEGGKNIADGIGAGFSLPILLLKIHRPHWLMTKNEITMERLKEEAQTSSNEYQGFLAQKAELEAEEQPLKNRITELQLKQHEARDELVELEKQDAIRKSNYEFFKIFQDAYALSVVSRNKTRESSDARVSCFAKDSPERKRLQKYFDDELEEESRQQDVAKKQKNEATIFFQANQQQELDKKIDGLGLRDKINAETGRLRKGATA